MLACVASRLKVEWEIPEAVKLFKVNAVYVSGDSVRKVLTQREDRIACVTSLFLIGFPHCLT